MSYSQFIKGMKKAEIEMDRRVLADLAVNDKEAFAVIVEQGDDALRGLAVESELLLDLALHAGHVGCVAEVVFAFVDRINVATDPE